jgi:hypothetical protein
MTTAADPDGIYRMVKVCNPIKSTTLNTASRR